MDKEDKYYIDLGKLGCSEENESLSIQEAYEDIELTEEDLKDYLEKDKYSAKCRRPNSEGPMIVLKDGSIYDVSNYETHANFAGAVGGYFDYDNDVDDYSNFDSDFLDYLEEDLGIITLNPGSNAFENRLKIVCGGKSTTSQLNVIRDFIDEMQKVFPANTTLYVWVSNHSQTYRLGDYTSDDIVKKIKMVFVRGRLEEKNYPQPKKLYNIDKETAYWPEDAEDFIYWHSEADKWADEYAKSYKVKMSPKDYLDLTTVQGADALKAGDDLGLGKLRDLDIDEFNKETYQNIFLQIAFRDENHPQRAQVVGHEGRHRMFALMQAGVKSVDVELIADVYNTEYNKYKPYQYEWIQLVGQFNKSVIVQVYNPIAMSWKQHKSIRPNLKDEELKEYLERVQVDDSSEYPVFATDDVYRLKAMLQKADAPYRIYNDDETYYFQNALGNKTHLDMLYQARDNGWLANSKLRVQYWDDEDDITSGEIYPEDYDEGYFVFIPKDFSGNLRWHTRLGDDSYYNCRVYDFGDLFVRDSRALESNLVNALGAYDRDLYYDSFEDKVSVVDNNGDTREFEVESELDGDPQNASTIDLSTKEISYTKDGTKHEVEESLKEDLNIEAKNLSDDINESYMSDYTNKSVTESMSRDEIEDRVANELGTSKEPIEGPSYILRDGSFLKIWNSDIDIKGMSGSKSLSGKTMHLDVDGFIEKEIDSDSLNSFYYLNVDCIRVNTGFEEYIVLPKYRPNNAQFESLEKWLNFYFFDKGHDKLKVMDWYGSYLNTKEYYLDTTMPEEIIKKIKSYYVTGELREEIKNGKLIVYRVGQVDDFKDGLFFADRLSYYDTSMTGYDKQDAEAYELDLSNAKVFDPMKEWDLEVNTWSDIRQEEEFFKEHDYPYYEYLDDLDYDDPDEYHEVTTDTDYLALWANEEGYDVVILRDIPGDNGYGEPETEYCVFNKNIIKKADLKEEYGYYEYDENDELYDTTFEEVLKEIENKVRNKNNFHVSYEKSKSWNTGKYPSKYIEIKKENDDDYEYKTIRYCDGHKNNRNDSDLEINAFNWEYHKKEYLKKIDELIDELDNLVESLHEKIVKVGSKWQVQSEKGKNLGTYDTKAEAEKRLQDVEMFKHMNEETFNKDIEISTLISREDLSDEVICYRTITNDEFYRLFSGDVIEGQWIPDDNDWVHFDNDTDRNTKIILFYTDYYRFRIYKNRITLKCKFNKKDIVAVAKGRYAVAKNFNKTKTINKAYYHYDDDMVFLDEIGVSSYDLSNVLEIVSIKGAHSTNEFPNIFNSNINAKLKQNADKYNIKYDNIKENLNEAEDRLQQVHYFKHMNEDIQETDNEGNVLSKEQVEFFKSSKVRNEQGRLIVCYHGTDNEFDVFDKSLQGTNEGTVWGKGFYFFKGTSSNADKYGSKVMKVYLNVTNPVKEESDMFAKILKVNYPKADIRDFEKYRQKYWNDFNDEYILPQYVHSKSKEFNLSHEEQYLNLEDLFVRMVKNAGYDGRIVDNEVICYEQNQIKSITNKNPTNSNNINEDLTESIHLIDKENKNCYYTYSAYDLKNFIDDRLVHGAMSVIKICYFFESDIYLFADGYDCIHEMLEEMAVEQGLVEEDELSERYLVYSKDNDDLEVIDYSEGKVFAYKNFKLFDASYNQTFKKTELYNILSWPVKEFKMMNGMFIKNGKAVTSLKNESLNESKDELLDTLYSTKEPEYGSCYLLDDGTFVFPFTKDEKTSLAFHGDEEDIIYDKHGQFKGYDLNHELQHDYNVITLNSREPECRMNFIGKPTNAQYSALLKWLDFVIAEGNDKVDFEDYGTEQTVGKFATMNLKDKTSEEIIDSIKRYFVSGVLVEYLNESNDNLYYHGSSQKGLTKLTSPINWITEDKDYAKYYALAQNNTAYVYTCEADLDNIFDAGKTGVRAYALMPLLKPYKLSTEMKNIANKLNLTEEQTFKLIEDAVNEYQQDAREYATKISTVVRSIAFKKILQEKGYTSIHTIEYNVPHSRYCDCYGILDSNDVKILSSEEVHYDAKLNDK